MNKRLGALILVLGFVAPFATGIGLVPCKFNPFPAFSPNCKPAPPAPCGIKGLPPCPKVTPPPPQRPWNPPPPTK